MPGLDHICITPECRNLGKKGHNNYRSYYCSGCYMRAQRIGQQLGTPPMRGRPEAGYLYVYALFDLLDSEQTPRYIGTTTQKLARRRGAHISNPTNAKLRAWIEEIGRKRVRIRCIEQCRSVDREARENYYMSLYPDTHNVIRAYPARGDMSIEECIQYLEDRGYTVSYT